MTATETIEYLGREIARLVAERQAMRAAAAHPTELERNRLAIGESQRRLSVALIARYA